MLKQAANRLLTRAAQQRDFVLPRSWRAATIGERSPAGLDQSLHRRTYLGVAPQLHFVSLVHTDRQVQNLLLEPAAHPVAIYRPFAYSGPDAAFRYVDLKLVHQPVTNRECLGYVWSLPQILGGEGCEG